MIMTREGEWGLFNSVNKLLTLSLLDMRSNSSPPEANSMTMNMSEGVSMNS